MKNSSFVRWMIVLSSSRAKPKRRPPAASCFPMRPRKSRNAARSSRSAPASCSIAAARPASVAVGDEVIYGKYSGTEIELDGRDVKILRESDILAKVSAEEKLAEERSGGRQILRHTDAQSALNVPDFRILR